MKVRAPVPLLPRPVRQEVGVLPPLRERPHGAGGDGGGAAGAEGKAGRQAGKDPRLRAREPHFGRRVQRAAAVPAGAADPAALGRAAARRPGRHPRK